ncbi:hypothetical protein B0J17DRAFT_708529 [Rhizoctonia solani]|nr:hypothetical protein B0J17DRAFT_708529 [Rhizoctonia solani]
MKRESIVDDIAGIQDAYFKCEVLLRQLVKYLQIWLMPAPDHAMIDNGTTAHTKDRKYYGPNDIGTLRVEGILFKVHAMQSFVPYPVSIPNLAHFVTWSPLWIWSNRVTQKDREIIYAAQVQLIDAACELQKLHWLGPDPPNEEMSESEFCRGCKSKTRDLWSCNLWNFVNACACL